MRMDVYTFSILFALGFIFTVVELVRKNRLQEKYSLLWIVFGILLILFSATPLFMEKIAAMLSIRYAPSLLFLVGLVFIIIYNLHLTTVVSSQSEKITRLIQEVSLLKEKRKTRKCAK